jgi:hypothetical protein
LALRGNWRASKIFLHFMPPIIHHEAMFMTGLVCRRSWNLNPGSKPSFAIASRQALVVTCMTGLPR